MDIEFIKELMANKAVHIAQKKAAIKHSDTICMPALSLQTSKALAGTNKDEIELKVVMNTTLVRDSHKDVHLNGIWTKTIKENKMLMHIQEHKMGFEYVIASGQNVAASIKSMSWRDLGYDVDGITEALIFETKAAKDRNPFMFEQYLKGYVTNHSVGMQYVKISLAVNDEEYPEEYEEWNKHISLIANKDEVIEDGYFWAIYEAKLMEGSAVLIGSNTITPTLEVKSFQPGNTTETMPGKPTLRKGLDYEYILNNLKIN